MSPMKIYLLVACVSFALNNEVVAECEYDTIEDKVIDVRFDVNVSTTEMVTIQSPCFPTPFITRRREQIAIWRIESTHDGCGLGFELLYPFLPFSKSRDQELKLSWDQEYTGDPNLDVFLELSQDTSILLETQAILYVTLDTPVAWLVWYHSSRYPLTISDMLNIFPNGFDSSFQMEVMSVCEKNVSCDDHDPCGPESTCEQLGQGYVCQCAPGYGGINCTDDSRIHQVFLAEKQIVIIDSPGYSIKLKNGRQHVWRVSGKPGCGIGMTVQDFDLNTDDHLKLRSGPSEHALMASFTGNPRPYAYIDRSTVWLELWTDFTLEFDDLRGFSLELSIRCFNMTLDICYASNPCGPRSECSDFVGGYYCSCDTWYTGVNCLEERRPVVVVVPDSVGELAVVSLGPGFSPAEDFLWRIDADLGCTIGAYFLEMRIMEWNDVLTVILDTPLLRHNVYQFRSSDLAYFFVESSQMWLEFKSARRWSTQSRKDNQFMLHVQCQRDTEVTRCDNTAPCQSGSTCSNKPYGYVCTCPPGYTGVNCLDETYVTHVYLSEEEDWQLQYVEPESWATVRNIWRIHGTLDCAIGVSTNHHGTGSILLLRIRFFEGSNIDTTFADFSSLYVDTVYMFVAMSDFVIQVTYREPPKASSHFEIQVETRCDEAVLSCDDSPCSAGSNCEDKHYGFVCECFPGFTGTNCSVGNHVHHIDLEMNSPIVLDPMQYLRSSYPYPQMSWYIQGKENHAIGVANIQEGPTYGHQLILNTERNLFGFIISKPSGTFFVFVQHSSIWLMCSEHVCTRFGATVLEISIQPSQAFSPDPCEQAECPSNDCRSLDIHVGYVCSCLPGFRGVDCKNDSGVQNNFVNSSELVVIPFPGPPITATSGGTTTFIQTDPDCGIGIIDTAMASQCTFFNLFFRNDFADDVLLSTYLYEGGSDKYLFFDRPSLLMGTYEEFNPESICHVTMTSQCNEGKMANCSPDTCAHGSLCTNMQGGGYVCQCQVGFAGIRCNDEQNIRHIERNASFPVAIVIRTGRLEDCSQAYEVEVTPGCGIVIDFRNFKIGRYSRLTIKDNLNLPGFYQSYTYTVVNKYFHFLKHTLWLLFHSSERGDTQFVLQVSESCVTANCSLGMCAAGSVCEDFYGGYLCDCQPGYGGAGCAEDVGVIKWILNPSQSINLYLDYNITCKVDVPDRSCGIEFFLSKMYLIIKSEYMLLTIQSSAANSTFLTASNGMFSEYGYFNLPTIWFQLYHWVSKPTRLSMFAQCDLYLQGINCASNPCSIHSDCFDHDAGYKCVCHLGYEGVNCSQFAEHTRGIIEYIQANNTNMTITICRSYQMCAYIGCGAVNWYGEISRCSCDDACERFADCCWDYQSACQTGGGGDDGDGFGISDPFGPVEETFDMPASVRPDMYSCFSSRKGNYLFVSRCPPAWDGSDSQARCENTTDFSDPLIFVPVSIGTEVTFRNVYCAICHGVQPANLTSWPVDFHCSDDEMILPSDIDEILDRIRSGMCNHTIDDANKINGASAYRRCAVDVISTCPEDFVDNGIAEACAGFIAPLQPPETQSVFANGYCVACNLPDLSYSEFTPCIGVEVGDAAPPAGFPLTVLVDFKGNNGIQFKVDRYVVKRETVECEVGAVFDSLAGICRSLSCATGLSLQDGECTWNVRCVGNRVGIELSGFNITNRECVSFQEAQGMMKCLADILELSLDDVFLVRANPDVDQCIAQDVNETLKVEIHVKMSYSEMSEMVTSSSRVHTCGASVLQFEVLCSDEDRPCQYGWTNVDYGKDVSMVSIDQTTYLTFRGFHATRRYTSVEVRRTTELQRSQENGTISLEEIVQICSDPTGNGTDPRLGDLPCPTITLNASEFHQVHIGDGTILVHLESSRNFTKSEFRMGDTGNVLVCSFLSERSGFLNVTTSEEFLQYSDTQSILSTVCVTLSLISLTVTLSTFIMFPSLRKLTNNKLLFMFCVFLFLAQLLTVVGSYASPIPKLCKVVSATTHFCWIAVFAITNSLAFDLHHTFGYNQSFTFAQTSLKSLVRYLVYVPGVSLCVVIPCVCIDVITDSQVLDYTYGDLCWVGDDLMRLLAFGVPMAVLLAINVIFFSYTAIGIWKGHQNAKKVGRKNMRPSFQERFDLLKIYIKVSTLMGFTWATAFIIPFCGISALWYLFIVLNGLQGVYIFLAFTANQRVWNLCKALVADEPSSRRSTNFTESTLGTDDNSRSARQNRRDDDDDPRVDMVID